VAGAAVTGALPLGTVWAAHGAATNTNNAAAAKL
jgi:hypothetical protein